MQVTGTEFRRRLRPGRVVLGLVALGGLCACLIVARFFVSREGGAPPAAASSDLTVAELERHMAGQETLATDVRVTLLPEEQRLVGEAVLKVRCHGGERRRFLFLLNSGLRVVSAEIGGELGTASSRGSAVVLQALRPVADGAVATIRIRYEGTVLPSPGVPVLLDTERILFPMLAFWYPSDLRSFIDFRCEAAMPEGLTVAVAGDATQSQVADGKRRTVWEEPRPVLGASLVAGRFERVDVAGEDGRVSVYRLSGREADVHGNARITAETYAYFVSLYGSDGYGRLTVVDGMVEGPGFHGGNGLVMLGNPDEKDEYERFLRCANLAARSWWGGTVAGRWMTTRPEGSAWLVEGLAEYSGWLALRDTCGRRAYLRHLEGLRVSTADTVAMEAVGLTDAAAPGDAARDFARVRAPYVAAMLDAYVGRDAFVTACRNLLKINRYSIVSWSSFRQEVELVCRRDLGPFFEAWLRQPGVFDYAIADVAQEGGRMRVSVENAGGIPAFADMEIAVVTETGVAMYSMEVDRQGGALVFETQAPLSRVVLDPAFETADFARYNNVWPRRVWPVDIAVATDGALVLSTKREWTAAQADRLTVADPATRISEHIKLSTPLAGEAVWSADGQQLAFDVSNRPCVWRRSGGVREMSIGLQFAGWRGDSPMLYNPTSTPHRWVAAPEGKSARIVMEVEGDRRPTGLLRQQPGADRFAYVASKRNGEADTGESEIRIVDFAEGTDTVVLAASSPSGNVSWTADGKGLVFLDRNGTLYRFVPGEGKPAAVLELHYRVDDSEVAFDGAAVAWRDPAGNLRMSRTEEPLAKHIALPGEVVAYAWQGGEGLICLVAQPIESFPMLCHASYSLWYVPAETLEARRMDMDPTRLQ